MTMLRLIRLPALRLGGWGVNAGEWGGKTSDLEKLLGRSPMTATEFVSANYAARHNRDSRLREIVAGRGWQQRAFPMHIRCRGVPTLYRLVRRSTAGALDLCHLLVGNCCKTS